MKNKNCYNKISVATTSVIAEIAKTLIFYFVFVLVKHQWTPNINKLSFFKIGAAYAGRFAMQAFRKVNWSQVQKAMPTIPDISLNAYYRGGFEPKMTKREASLILGIM